MAYAGSQHDAVEVLLSGLEKMQYRGYDSAGIGVATEQTIEIMRAQGKLAVLQDRVLQSGLPSLKARMGLGHTRWATHGKPSEKNAHPHRVGHLAIVHNGIIENFSQLKMGLGKKGYFPQSDTDTEVLGLMILSLMDEGLDLAQAVNSAFEQIQGRSSIVVISQKEFGKLVAMRSGSPLILAMQGQEYFVASDVYALLGFSPRMVFLEDDDLLCVTAQGYTIANRKAAGFVGRAVQEVSLPAHEVGKAGFAHFMLKEISEQPQALRATLEGLRVGRGPIERLFNQAPAFVIVACGSSYHAALLGKWFIEHWLKKPVMVEFASELRYREVVLIPQSLVIGISQSGETADTLAAVQKLKLQGYQTLAIGNGVGSSMHKMAHYFVQTFAGPEIGVAATKTFLCQVLVMALIAGGLDAAFVESLDRLPACMGSLLEDTQFRDKLRAVAAFGHSDRFFFLGRGLFFPVALEGALKLKEVAYDFAEGYAAGELKHGPIAMIDDKTTVIVLGGGTDQILRDKMMASLQEVKARGARIVSVSADVAFEAYSDVFMGLPASLTDLENVFASVVVLQLFSYYRGLVKGTDIDQPRNLAKSVTVE
jgi:glucosamine--fructose-6-phosphate aminotransferase (isomerizing)